MSEWVKRVKSVEKSKLAERLRRVKWAECAKTEVYPDA